MELASERPSLKKAFFLFMLGTDTKFQASPSRDYPQGETLSFMAQYLAALTGQQSIEPSKTQKERAIAFQTSSIRVLNGPNTLGREVGQRIAEGIITILEALTQETPTEQLFVAAHSRGACQAMLLAHELKRLQLCIGPLAEEQHLSLNLADLVIDSPCPYTKAALNASAPTIRALTGKYPDQKLLAALKGLTLIAFLIDPVPGTMQTALVGHTSLNWNDARFKKPVPSKDYELLIYEHERTSMFYPALPYDTQHLVIPGHHGTGSGNNKTQKGYALGIPGSEEHLSVVQNLVVVKMLRLMKKHGLFASLADTAALCTGHPQLDTLAAEELQRNDNASDLHLLKLYATLREHFGTYKKLEEDTYRLLPSTGSARFALHAGKHVALDSFTLDVGGDGTLQKPEPPRERLYINMEEAFLDMQTRLLAEEPAQRLQAIQSLLEEAGNMPHQDGQASPLAASLHSRKVQNYFISLLGTAFDSIAEHYLRGSLRDSSAREAFWACLRTLKRPDARQNQDFLRDLQSAIAVRIETALHAKLADLARRFESNVQLDIGTLDEIEVSLRRLTADQDAVSEFFGSVEFNEGLLTSIQNCLQNQKSAWQREEASAAELEQRVLEEYNQQLLDEMHQAIIGNNVVFQNPNLAKLASLCYHYRTHLLKALTKDEQNTINKRLRHNTGRPEDDLIQKKLSHLYQMQTALYAKRHQSILQKEDLQDFMQAFQRGKPDFASQRSGKLFVKRIAIIVGIVFSGILPGLICLGVFAHRSKTAVLRVKGEGFSENIEKNLNALTASA